jgi:hypothetical protein
MQVVAAVAVSTAAPMAQVDQVVVEPVQHHQARA